MLLLTRAKFRSCCFGIRKSLSEVLSVLCINREKKLLRACRITAVLMVFCVLKVSAVTYGQSISLKLSNVPIETVFKEIRKQALFDFLYKDELLAKVPRISIEAKNATIEEVLDLCFKELSIDYLVQGKSIMLREKDSVKPNSQSKSKINIKGRVVNESNEPLPNVTVTVKGYKISTTTDQNGEFTLLMVETNAILVFTHVGMETEELEVNGQTQLVVKMKRKISELGEAMITVSTGYEDIPKERATGSFSNVDTKTLNQQVGTNILRRLEGVTTAFLFDTKPQQAQKRTNISVRGFSSINGPLDPLIVLDGFIYEGDIDNINPNIIESITILKDAAAASIWGARAGNGVIVIKSKSGSFNQKLQVGVNSSIIVSSKPDLYYLPQMTSRDYIDVEQFFYSKGIYNNLFTSATRPAISPAIEIFNARELGLISSDDSAAQIDALKRVDIRDEFYKHFYTNAITQQNTIDLRGGSNTNAYLLSIGFDKSIGETYNTRRKINIRLQNTFRPFKNFEAYLGVFYTNARDKSGRPSYGNININGKPVPYLRFADENGNPVPVAIAYRDGYTDTAGQGRLLDWKYYPLTDYKHNRSTYDRNELYTNISLKYKMFRFLDVDIKYQYHIQRGELERIRDIESYEARNRINMFSQINFNTGVVNYIVPKGGIKTQESSNTQSQTLRSQIAINQNWGIHSISGIFGAELRSAVRNGSSFTVYGYNQDPASNGVVDYVNRYPTYINQSKQNIPGAPEYNPEKNERFVSIYSNIAYTLKNRYIFTFSARKDGSNVFGVNTNDRWKPLWSSGLGWNISKEKFYRISSLPVLKLRVTFGYSGNVDVSRSAVPVATYNTTNHSVTNFPFGVIYTLNNPELRWEQTSTLNLGADFSSRNQRISGSIEYYVKKGKDLYGPSPYDYTTFGLDDVITKNVANMEGKGLEVALHTRNIDKAFKWYTSIFFTRQDHKVTKYNTEEATNISQILSSGTRITPLVGKPLYAIAAYKWGGLDNAGNPQGYLQGQLSTDYLAIRNITTDKGEESGSVIYIGSAIPTTFGSFINTFSWKNFEVSINLLYKLNYYFRKSTISYTSLANSGLGHKEYELRWQKPGDENITNVPSFIYPNVTGRDAFYGDSEINVLKGDHIRLHYINFLYSFNDDILRVIGVNQLQIYFNASNLGIIWRANNHGIDPEYPEAIPLPKSWAAGLRLSF